jgi:hypothetical protein
MGQTICIAVIFLTAILSVSIYAQDVSLPGNGQTPSNETEPDEEIFMMDDLRVTEKVYRQDMGRTDIPREFIKNMPKGNGNITDLLTIVPGVQFGEGYRSVDSAAEISPAEISISGGKPYDNLFIIDGISNSSQLDPAAESSDWGGAGGHSQKFFISSWLVEDVSVFDTDISAEYDGFAGGVVKVTTKRPAQKFGGNLAYRTTQSRWTHFYIEESDSLFLNQEGKAEEPDFIKNSYSAALNIPITDKTALILNYERRDSTISKEYFKNWRNEYLLAETYLLKASHNIDGNSYLDASASYAPYVEELFKTRVKDSDYTERGGGFFGAVEYNRENDSGKFTLHTDYSFSENSSAAPKDFKEWIATKSKPWGVEAPIIRDDGSIDFGKNISEEGGYGDIDKWEKKFTANLRHEFEHAAFAGEHKLRYGLDYALLSGRYNRKETSYHYSRAVEYTDVLCNGDLETCVLGEQYFSGRTVYPQSDVQVSVNTYSAFVEETWGFSRLLLRAGLRATNDDYMDNLDIAPRSQLQWDIFGNKNTIVSVGYNRYYTAALLANKLREGRKPWYEERRWTYHNTIQEWAFTDAVTQTTYNFKSLNTPYDDEYAAGIDQALFGGNINIKYVLRESRDEFAMNITQKPDGTYFYSLNNRGWGRYQSASVKWFRKWKNHYVMINGGWTESTSSDANYNNMTSLEETMEDVFFDGRLVKRGELPKANFSRPIIINLAYTGHFFDHLLLGTNIKFRGEYDSVESGNAISIIHPPNPLTGEEEHESIETYYSVHYDNAFLVDCTLAWEQKLPWGDSVTVTLEVANLLDAKNRVRGEVNGFDTYELGRQFWAGIAYEF